VNAYYVYVIRCFDGTFYVGVTNNVDRRFWEHEQGLDPHCYTSRRRPLRLVHVAEFQWIQEAITYEKTLKKWSHRKKRALCDGAWKDVSRYARGKNRHER
jgi:putative endonuclease